MPPHVRLRVRLSLLSALAAAVLLGPPALANVPPNTPTITEPQVGRIINAEDLHMECAAFADADPGDTHRCTDWEVRLASTNERVWAALCVSGIDTVHIHIADGTFQGTHAGRLAFLPSTNYVLYCRHRDSSNDALTEWSAFATRPFTTGAASSVFPLELDDIAATPTPQWTDSTGAAIVLPSADAVSTSSLFLNGLGGGLLLQIAGSNGTTNAIINPSAPLAAHEAVRLEVRSGTSQHLSIPESTLAFADETGIDQLLYLPAIDIANGASAFFWVAANGSTFIGQSGQTTPDFSTLARGAAVPWIMRKPGFRVEVFSTGFQLPVNIAFNPNTSNPDAPFFYVTELYGTIRAVYRDGHIATYATGLLNFNPTGDFPGSGEQGLAGLCVDPVSGDLFVSVLYDSAPPNGPHYPKVVRFHSNDGGRTAATQTIILNMPGETMGQSHQISNLSIGPDNRLYIHVGDGFDQARGRDITSHRGKILRIAIDGTTPTDNPFYNIADGISATDRIFVLGLRNPFGGAWRASDGKHYWVENGPSVDRFAQAVRGRDYLYDGSDNSMRNFALYSWDPSHAPVNIAFVEPQTFNAGGFPASFHDHAFVTESGPTWGTGPQALGKRLVEFSLNAAGAVTSGPTPFVEYNGSGKASAVALAVGPDGLYFSDLYKDVGYTTPIDVGANILRIRFVGTADFYASAVSGGSPLTVTFTPVITVPNPTSYLWTFGDGATSTDQIPTHTYTSNGSYSVRLTVGSTGGPVVTQKNDYIRVGQPPRIAFLGAALPSTASDQAAIAHLRAINYTVTQYNGDPAQRPAAAELAQQNDLVIVSSTISSANVGGEFRTAPVPLIFWESALLRSDREPLASAGATFGAQSTITIAAIAHPITQGFTGSLPFFAPAATASIGTGTRPAGVQTLALRTGSTDGAIMIADAGITLVPGYTTPARRVFLPFEDASFSSATAQAVTILDRSVCWAINGFPTIIANPAPASPREGAPVQFTGTATGSGLSYQWLRNGAPISNSTRITGANTPTLSISHVNATDAGQYALRISSPCATATTTSALLTVLPPCPADFDDGTGTGTLDGGVGVEDLLYYLARYDEGVVAADLDDGSGTGTPDGGVGIEDLLYYLARYDSGC